MKNPTTVSLAGRPENALKAPVRRAGNTAKAARNVAVPLSPAERERIRAALHDGLGQLLTSISFLATALRQKLAAKEMPEASEAEDIALLTGRAISETQALVQGDTPRPISNSRELS